VLADTRAFERAGVFGAAVVSVWTVQWRPRARRHHGVRPKTLSWWRWQLGRARKALTSPRWIPVAVRQAPPIAQTSTSLCVVLPACELRVGVGTDPSYVGKLVASLRAC